MKNFTLKFIAFSVIAILAGMGIAYAGSFSSRYNSSSGDMIYGEIYSNDTATTTVSIASGATYTKITTYTANGLSNGTTPDHTTDKITLNTTGKYKASGETSFLAGTNNVNFRGALFLNGTEQEQCHWQRKIGTASDTGSASFTCFINATTTPVAVDFRVRTSAGGAINFAAEYQNLNLFLVGE